MLIVPANEKQVRYAKAGLYCIQEGFTAAETTAFLMLADDLSEERLRGAWTVWKDDYWVDFSEAVEAITGQECAECDYCARMVWSEDTQSTADYEIVCDRCVDRWYQPCVSCETLHRNTTSVGGYEYCNDCLTDHHHWCDECDEWADREHEHAHGCDCEAPHKRFEFPANGQGTVAQNERLTVELPAGTIDEMGLQDIAHTVGAAVGWEHHRTIQAAIAEVGPTWQTRRGNFTRRLSSALHKQGIKLEQSTISQIGNLARQHSSDETFWDVAFTRDLNLPAEAFWHEDSCWWGSLYRSRCCLKNWGGLGLRTFDGPIVTGRAWILPMRHNTTGGISDHGGWLSPTHDTMGADAYLVFNAYGDDLTSYKAARIVAHLTGRTYKHVGFRHDGDCEEGEDAMYINGETAKLVASEDICSKFDEIELDLAPHDRCDADEQRVRAA